jgi:hypothetical protein
VQVIGQGRTKTERLLLVHRNSAVQRHHAQEISAARPATERARDNLIGTPLEFVLVHRFQHVLIAYEKISKRTVDKTVKFLKPDFVKQFTIVSFFTC